MTSYDENYEELKNLIEEIEKKLNNLNKIKKKDEEIFFTIGNTAYNASKNRPYLTPIRKINKGYVFGIVIYSQLQAIIISDYIDNKVDAIFVDCEKKLLATTENDYSVLNKFELGPAIDNLVISENELGNISKTCHNVITRTPIFSYKANDLIVESVWLFLIHFYKELSGKKIVIIGGGNIGCKLCLKFIECAAKINVVTKKGKSGVFDSLNLIKQKSVIEKINISEKVDETFKKADAIIGCANSNEVIEDSMIELMNSNGVVIDVGKGNISRSAYKKISKKNIPAWRADITPMIDSMVNTAKDMKYFSDVIFASKKIKNFSIVSGGYIGNKYDVIVDNVKNVSHIYGVCDGMGSFMSEIDDNAINNIEEVKKVFNQIKEQN